MPRLNRVLLVRLIFWPIAIVLGASQAWSARHFVFSDGISYVEIANAYALGDWAHAINAYWSPLYSWVLAGAFVVLHPSAYWQGPVAHLIGFLSYIAVLLAFEFFMKELLHGHDESRSPGLLPAPFLYLVGYCSAIFLTLAVGANIGTISPDVLAMALVIVLVTLVLRIRRTGGSTATFLMFGIVGALCYLTKGALLSTVLICFAVVLVLRYRTRRDVLRPTAILALTLAVLMAPFVAAISRQQGKFTIGESARLNYAWEVDGAHRWVHWQGEPYDIGRPQHPTLQVISSPRTFVFTAPVGGTYPPWYNPAYWYAGVQPKLKLGAQLWVFVVNLSVALDLLVKSPVFLPTCALILVSGIGIWWRRFAHLWPIWLPMLAAIVLYCLVYVERRYVGANLVVFWMAMLVSVRSDKTWIRRWAPMVIGVFASICLLLWGAYRYRWAVKETFADLVQGREGTPSLDYLLAQRFLELGLHDGDKIAYVGLGMIAEWPRLIGVKIVAEVPVMHGRNLRLFDNSHTDDYRQIRAFSTADPATRERVLDAFRRAGAKMVVSDGYLCKPLCIHWQRALSGSGSEDDDDSSQANTRYLWLDSSRDESAQRTPLSPRALGIEGVKRPHVPHS